MHTGTTISATGAGAAAKATLDLSRIQENTHYPILAFSNDEPGTVSVEFGRGPWDDRRKRGRNELPVSVWGVVVLPRYTGGESGLKYKRGHLRYETFDVGPGEEGDPAIGP